MPPNTDQIEPVARRRVLLSCFACSPFLGSEPGVGWRWLLEIVKRHDVLLLTHPYFRNDLELALTARPIDNLEIHYFAPENFGLDPVEQVQSRLFYFWWQMSLPTLVRRLLDKESADLIHHLTWGTYRFPCRLGDMGVPLVMGPLGGGEVAPWRLFKGLPWRDLAYELVRVASMRLARFGPFSSGPKASALVFCRTEETREALPESVHPKSLIAPEIGAPSGSAIGRHDRPMTQRPFRLLFAGQLRGIKGPSFALGAAHLAAVAGFDVSLDIAGEGPLQAHLERQIKRLGMTHRVRLLGKIPREDLFKLYGQSDLFLFPSLHDSSGSVILESLAHGLPVVCLDLGGPKNYLTSGCGIVVSTHGRSRIQVEQSLADAVTELIKDPRRLLRMSDEAIRQAGFQTWESNVARTYRIIEQKLNWTGSSAP